MKDTMKITIVPETIGIEIQRAIYHNRRKKAYEHDRKKSLKYVLYCRKNAKTNPDWRIAYTHYRDKHLTEYKQKPL